MEVSNAPMWRETVMISSLSIPMHNRECARTSQMGERIDTLIEENKTLKHIAGDFNRIKKVLGQETIDSALEASWQEEIHRKASKRKQKEYSR